MYLRSCTNRFGMNTTVYLATSIRFCIVGGLTGDIKKKRIAMERYISNKDDSYVGYDSESEIPACVNCASPAEEGNPDRLCEKCAVKKLTEEKICSDVERDILADK